MYGSTVCFPSGGLHEAEPALRGGLGQDVGDLPDRHVLGPGQAQTVSIDVPERVASPGPSTSSSRQPDRRTTSITAEASDRAVS